MKNMNYIRRGQGSPLLLVHGLGGSSESWNTVLNRLAHEREVIAIDLPGFGATPPLNGDVSNATLADAVTEFLDENDLLGIDAVGSSVGARLVLELARRGKTVGAVVSLSPVGFWNSFERHAFYASNFTSIRLIRALQPVLGELVRSRTGRTALLAQFSEHPWKLEPAIVLNEMRNYAQASSFEELLRDIAYGEEQKGARFGSISSPLVIGWGRQDRICFPSDANRAYKKFPDAKLRWFDHCGHFPHWDAPGETVQLILENTGTENPSLRLKSPAAEAAADSKTAEPVRSMPYDSPAW